jgi:L,D-transpeptidase ErfK/SrfK
MAARWLRHVAVAAAVSVPLSGHGEPGLSHQLSGAVVSYIVRPGDTLTAISARYGVGVPAIRSGNRLAPGSVIVAGQTLAIDSRHVVPLPVSGETVVVNVPQRMLFQYANDALVAAYPVAVGRTAWPTPTGAFTVTLTEHEPVWDVPASIREEMRREGRPVVTSVAPGPENPLGDYWIGLSIPRIGIHGTPYPATVYRAATHGCLRLHPEDIAALFPGVRAGARGHIIYEPVMAAVVDEAILLEAHRDVYRRGDGDVMNVLRGLERDGSRLDWDAVDQALAIRDGVPRRVGLRSISHH